MQVYKLSKACSVAAQILPADVKTLGQNGYGIIVCNRPDAEDFGQPSAESIATECARHGVLFIHLPISNTGITTDMIEQFKKIMAESDGQLLAYCRSGQRSSVLWQASGSP